MPKTTRDNQFISLSVKLYYNEADDSRAIKIVDRLLASSMTKSEILLRAILVLGGEEPPASESEIADKLMMTLAEAQKLIDQLKRVKVVTSDGDDQPPADDDDLKLPDQLINQIAARAGRGRGKTK